MVRDEKQGSSLKSFMTQPTTFKEVFLRWVIDKFQPYSIGQAETFRDMVKWGSTKEKVPTHRNQIPIEVSKIYACVKEKFFECWLDYIIVTNHIVVYSDAER
jgi:hypothetical protein